ncbi:unnamed protein product [Ectocarpus sp. 6 AP-2014]
MKTNVPCLKSRDGNAVSFLVAEPIAAVNDALDAVAGDEC